MTKQSKAPVSVVMPEIKLNVADLAYMTGLLPGATRCLGSHKITDKLSFLGLIEKSDIPACPKATAKFDKDREDWKVKTRKAIVAGDWNDLLEYGVPYQIQSGRRPRPSTDFVLTKAGLDFMAKGRTSSITSMKAGCVK